MRNQTYPSCRSLSFQLVLLKPSENPINPRLKKKRVYFNLHFITVVSQPCMLQRIYHSTALCILLWLACRTGAIFGPFQASRNEREASAERESCASRLTRAMHSPCTLQNAKITPVLQAICGQLRFHGTLAVSPLVVVRGSDKEECYIYILYYSWSHQWTITA